MNSKKSKHHLIGKLRLHPLFIGISLSPRLTNYHRDEMVNLNPFPLISIVKAIIVLSLLISVNYTRLSIIRCEMKSYDLPLN